MTSYMPPAERIWWKMPVGRQELMWIGISLVWCLIMFLMMPYWHVYGKQNLSTEAYQTTPAKFGARVQEMVEKYKVGEEGGIPVVKPLAAPVFHGLAARIFTAADQRQSADRARLRNGVAGHARPGWRIRCYLQ